jgi:hypothetical protein
VDVTKKHVTGRPGYTSESKWRYCPKHEAGMIRTDTRFDGLPMFFYWILSLLCGAVVVVTAVVFAVRIALSPILGIMVLSGKLPGRALLPFGADDRSRLSGLDAVLVLGSLVLGVVMLIMYIIW